MYFNCMLLLYTLSALYLKTCFIDNLTRYIGTIQWLFKKRISYVKHRLLEFLFPSFDCENVNGYHMKCMSHLFKNLKSSAFCAF